MTTGRPLQQVARQTVRILIRVNPPKRDRIQRLYLPLTPTQTPLDELLLPPRHVGQRSQIKNQWPHGTDEPHAPLHISIRREGLLIHGRVPLSPARLHDQSVDAGVGKSRCIGRQLTQTRTTEYGKGRHAGGEERDGLPHRLQATALDDHLFQRMDRPQQHPQGVRRRGVCSYSSRSSSPTPRPSPWMQPTCSFSSVKLGNRVLLPLASRSASQGAMEGMAWHGLLA
mmetsp:Transcript_37279/g.106645  ORF Transcript_37279/g.106645 Transcript_37279/m.106645 type:complete len:227 (+) Transcript_37279:225-905(+)